MRKEVRKVKGLIHFLVSGSGEAGIQAWLLAHQGVPSMPTEQNWVYC